MPVPEPQQGEGFINGPVLGDGRALEIRDRLNSAPGDPTYLSHLSRGRAYLNNADFKRKNTLH